MSNVIGFEKYRKNKEKKKQKSPDLGLGTSVFTDYRKYLYDLPSVMNAQSIRCKFTEFKDSKADSLDYYCKDKLLNYFILKVKEAGYLSILTRNMRRGKVPQNNYYSTYYNYDAAFYFDKQSIKQCVSLLIDTNNEFSILFKEFAKDIANANIYLIKYNYNQNSEFLDPDSKESFTTAESDFISNTLNNLDIYKSYNSFKNFYNVSGERDYSKITSEMLSLKTLTLQNAKRNMTFDLESAKKLGLTIEQKIKERLETASYQKELKYIFKEAALLEKRLDITFDPDKDIVKSLPVGKIDSNKISEFLSGNSKIYQRVEETFKTKPFKVVLLLDFSGSMTSDYKLAYAIDSIRICYHALSKIMPSEDILVYAHSGGDDSEVCIVNDFDDADRFEENLIAMQYLFSCRNNYDAVAISAIHQHIRKKDPDSNYLMLVFSDGYPAGSNYGGEPAIKHLGLVCEKLKRDSFIVAGLAIKYKFSRNFLSYKPYQYHTQIEKLSDMPKKVSSILSKIVKTEFQ